MFLLVDQTLHGDDAKNIPPTVIKRHYMKLQENAVRARYELERRDRRNGALMTTLIASLVGATLGLLGGLIVTGTWP